MQVGALLGLISMACALPLINFIRPELAQLWYRTIGPASSLRLRKRARVALTKHKVRMAWPLLIPLLNPLILVVPAEGEGILLVAGYWGGYSLGVMFSYLAKARAVMRQFRDTMAYTAAVQLVRRDTVAEAWKILEEAIHRDDPCHRIGATYGLKELGTPEALAALQTLATDKDPEVASIASQQLEVLQRLLDPTRRPCPELPEELMEKVFKGIQSETNDREERKLAHAEEVIARGQFYEIIMAQLPLRRSFPHLYCHRCLAWAVNPRKPEWDWVECRLCGKVEALETDVRQVVGQIGGDWEWLLNESGILNINLWDVGKKVAKTADIDVLEILADADMDYDWAVSAVLEKLGQRPQQNSKRWKIRTVGEPSLTKNTVSLLLSADPEFLAPHSNPSSGERG